MSAYTISVKQDTAISHSYGHSQYITFLKQHCLHKCFSAHQLLNKLVILHLLGITFVDLGASSSIYIPIRENGVGNNTRVWCAAAYEGPGGVIININSQMGTITIQGN